MNNEKYISLNAIACMLGLPRTYIIKLAEAGSIPTILIGRQVMANIDAVEKTLAEMSANELPNGVSHISEILPKIFKKWNF